MGETQEGVAQRRINIAAVAVIKNARQSAGGGWVKSDEKEMIISDKIANMMSDKDRKALKVLLPGERMKKLEAQSEKELQRLCEMELNRRNIAYLHLSF
ncbi:MAG: hypothetical protein WC450_09920, partial [Candidatus Omnitrophota bacterium]